MINDEILLSYALMRGERVLLHALPVSSRCDSLPSLPGALDGIYITLTHKRKFRLNITWRSFLSFEWGVHFEIVRVTLKPFALPFPGKERLGLFPFLLFEASQPCHERSTRVQLLSSLYHDTEAKVINEGHEGV